MSIKNKYLINIFINNKVLVFFLVLFIVIQSIFSVLVTKYLEKVIDSISVLKSLNIYYFLICIFVLIITYILLFASKYFSSVLVQKMSFEIKLDILKKLKQIKYQEFELMKIGDINSVLTDDIEEASQIIKVYTSGFFMSILEATFIFVYMCIMNFRISIICLLGILTMNFITKIFVPKITKKTYEIKKEKGKINEIIKSILETIDVAKIFSCNNYVKNIYDQNRYNLYKNRLSANYALQNNNMFLNILSCLIINGSIIYFSYLTIRSSGKIGSVIAIMVLIEKFINSSSNAFREYGNIGRINGAWNRVNHIFNIQSEEEFIINNSEISSLSIEDVDFEVEGKKLLNSVNLTLQKGYVYCIKGESGSGKTVLLKTLMGLYSKSNGRILLQDNEVGNIYQNVAYVPAVPKLFNTSIYKNLTVGSDNIHKEEVIEVCKQFGAHEWIVKKDNSYDTQINCDGETLSGGQVQIIAIIRAFLMDRTIIIMDEPYSNLDIETETKLCNYINKNKDNKIIIFSSNKENTFQYCDKVLQIN